MKRYKVSDKCTISKGRETLEPGREVPAGYFDTAQFEALFKKGHIVEIEEAPAPEPEAKQEAKPAKGVEKKAKSKDPEPEKESDPDEPVSFE